jgi:hypothetical protein
MINVFPYVQICPLTAHEDYKIILKQSLKTRKIRLNKPEDCSIQQIACIQESSAKIRDI